MTKKKLMATLAAVLSLSLCGGIFTGCGSRETTATPSGSLATEVQQEKQGGVISIKVNPEIAVHYDEQGMVTGIEARNDDGKKIVADYTGFEGKECRVVIGDLVAAINEAGYFVEETEGKTNQITLEIEEGSVLPEEDFLNMIVAEIQKYTSAEKISTPVTVDGESTYGWSNYGDTDYGPDNDGVTDYADTDYGTTGDGVTDYDDKKPSATSGTGNNSTTNNNSSNNNGSTDYGNTNYGNTNYGNTNYGNTDYGTNSDGVTDYNDNDSGYGKGQTTTAKPSGSTSKPSTSKPTTSKPAASTPSGGASQSGDSGYDNDSGYDSDSGYDNGNSGYDSGNSGYDKDSAYGDSGYDD